ncbi:hypothetical protein DCC85_06055 [Paenibacillus sp. CAA11]|uniref:hypothetical protein n=1 Tax=Paenibacillus sp. CAA11 TaxID=1532905 RepID=UPI000D3BD433|nr:hypothetical protein [Paenibacillus sp. CAA11]AWB43827.1 hypothetical protein DCC85_06055 [Paenibacillus sp. CAA11]
MTNGYNIWKLAAQSLQQGIAITDRAGRILESNSSWETFAAKDGLPLYFGWQGVNLIQIAEFRAADGDLFSDRFLHAAQQGLHGKTSYIPMEYSKNSCNDIKWLSLDIAPWHSDSQQEISGLTLIIRETEPFISLSSHNNHLAPMCAVCKRIRDDHEEWNTIESYLKKCYHTEFTHDICPDCIRRVYPKYASILNTPKQ